MHVLPQCLRLLCFAELFTCFLYALLQQHENRDNINHINNITNINGDYHEPKLKIGMPLRCIAPYHSPPTFNWRTKNKTPPELFWHYHEEQPRQKLFPTLKHHRAKLISRKISYSLTGWFRLNAQNCVPGNSSRRFSS